jgi:hypothetical protein
VGIIFQEDSGVSSGAAPQGSINQTARHSQLFLVARPGNSCLFGCQSFFAHDRSFKGRSCPVDDDRTPLKQRLL